MFDLINTVVAASPQQKSYTDEIDLKLDRLNGGDCPLQFWKFHQDIFPILSRLVKRYLAPPRKIEF
jgi:hypothetical protein